MSHKLDVGRCELACKLRMDENGTKHHIKHDFEDTMKVPRGVSVEANKFSCYHF